jgi:hypothetical protein
MAIPAQRFRVAKGADYAKSHSVSTGREFMVSLTQLRGGTFGNDTRKFKVLREGEHIANIMVEEERGLSDEAGSANALVTINRPGNYTFEDVGSGKRASVSVTGSGTGGGLESDQTVDPLNGGGGSDNGTGEPSGGGGGNEGPPTDTGEGGQNGGMNISKYQLALGALALGGAYKMTSGRNGS